MNEILCSKSHGAALAGAGDGEHHAGAEDARRQQDDDRPDQPQQRRGRPLAPVRCAPGVVAGETVEDRPGLEGDRAEQQHAEEDVQGEQAADPQDRVALDEPAGSAAPPLSSRSAARCPRPRLTPRQAGTTGMPPVGGAAERLAVAQARSRSREQGFRIGPCRRNQLPALPACLDKHGSRLITIARACDVARSRLKGVARFTAPVPAARCGCPRGTPPSRCWRCPSTPTATADPWSAMCRPWRRRPACGSGH